MAQSRDLEISEDIKHERWFWKLERIGWIVLGLVAVCALGGFLGPGPASKQKRSDPTFALTAEYNRYDRYQAPTTLRVRVQTNAVENGKLRLSLNTEFVEAIEIRQIQPSPEKVEMGNGKFTYVFDAPELKQATSVIFHYEPDKFWKTPGELSVGDKVKLNFTQVFYP